LRQTNQIVIRPAVAQQQVGEIHRKERIPDVAGGARRGRAVLDAAIAEASEGLRVGRVLIGVDRNRRTGRHDARHQLFDCAARGLGRGAAVLLLEPRASATLRRGERPAAAQLGIVEAVDVVGGADQEIQIEGPVLARLEASKTIEHERLAEVTTRAELLVQQQAVASESLRLALQGAGRDVELARDLAQARAADSRWARRSVN
jgi:hypothetical protein